MVRANKTKDGETVIMVITKRHRRHITAMNKKQELSFCGDICERRRTRKQGEIVYRLCRTRKDGREHFTLTMERRGVFPALFAEIRDFTTSPAAAETFFRLLWRMRVLPEHLLDVYDDVFG